MRQIEGDRYFQMLDQFVGATISTRHPPQEILTQYGIVVCTGGDAVVTEVISAHRMRVTCLGCRGSFEVSM